MRYNILYLILNLLSFCISISPSSEVSKENSAPIAAKYIYFTGQYMTYCKTNIHEGKKSKAFELVLYAEISGFTHEENFILNLPSAYMTCTIPDSKMVESNVTCILNTNQFYIDTIYLPEEFPKISDFKVSFWNKVPKQIQVNCSAFDKESLIMEHNLSYKPIYELFQAKDNDNLIFTNYYNRENVEKVVIFQSRKDYCYNTYFLIYFEAKISGYYSDVNYKMRLSSPIYSHMDCILPSSYYSSDKRIECRLNTEKFPVFYNGLNFNYHDISGATVYYWERVNSKIEYSCYPHYEDMYPQIIKEPECVFDDYNTFITYASVNKPKESNFTFNLSVYIYPNLPEILCEFYYKEKASSYTTLYYCYSKDQGEINFFPTTVKTNIATKYMMSYQYSKKIKLQKCSITKKTIYFNFGLQNCSKKSQYDVHSNIILYSKMTNFSSDYSFNIDLVNSSYAYLECYIPYYSGFQPLSYIECVLDRLKFPLLDEETITLPTNLSIEDIDILHWDFIDKEYNISSCVPEYNFIFSPEKYNDSYCYKAYNSLFSTIGQISSIDSNNTKNASDYYNFDINAIVDGKLTKVPCELINLNESNSPNNYKLDCIAYGNVSAEIFKTIVFNVESENKDLIYINISHFYTLKQCIPTKIIAFKYTKVECIPKQNIFNIYLYADMNGFNSEEKLTLILKKPSYIYAKCTIPKSDDGSSDQYILCNIDTIKFPFIDLNIITLPDEFIKTPSFEYGIFGWENINKEIQTKKCSSNYDISFTPINILDIECYSNGYNAFIADGNLISNDKLNIKSLKIYKFNINAIIDSQYDNIPCEIFPPDSSNINSRIYCYSNAKNYAEIFPTISKYENSQGNIYINIFHKYNYKICPESKKMIFIKSIETDCLSNDSILKLLIHSEIIGFSSEEKIKINLEEPNPSFIECTIPKLQEYSFIQCEMDVSKFPLIKYDKITMPETLINITNCDIMNWNNINKVLSSGNCYQNYLLTFSSSVSIQPECYDKNYNSFIIKGILDKKESFISNINEIHTFSLNSFFNNNYYDTILCDIYPPDSTSYEFRMFCYTNKTDNVELFQTIATDVNTQENIYINITNYHFDLLDCSSNDKIIYFKNINVNYEKKPLINIDIKAAISGNSQNENFKIFLKEPNYSYITCALPSIENNSKEITIECNYDTQNFPLIENKTMILPKNFPQVQGYSIANSDFNEKKLFINYYNPPYSISFIPDRYIDSNCYKIGINVFSVMGKIIVNGVNDINNDIYTFNNFMIIDDKYSNASCKIYQVESAYDEYQMDCYTSGIFNAILFKTISIEQNTNKNIYIDCNHKYLLNDCSEPVKRIIDFKQIGKPKCMYDQLSNNVYLHLNITASVFGITEEKYISFNLSEPSHFIMNCIIPISRNGETNSTIKCSLNALIFPIINNYNIILPYDFPQIEDIEILNWDKMDLYLDIYNCYPEYQLIFSNIISNNQNCKSKNENLISLLGSLKDKNNFLIYNKSTYSFTLSGLINKELKNISCEIYPSFKNQDYYRMDCNIIVNNNLEFKLFNTIVNDELNGKNIYINSNNTYNISECFKYNKFINFNGKIDMKSDLGKSLFELDIYSEIIGFEEEKTININLDYPKYSKMNCTIPSSITNNNNTYIKFTMDSNKYPLIKGDNIILPNNIFDKENCSLTKWDKVQKNIEINFSSVEYSILFSSNENQNNTSCDDKGNNIMIISGLAQTSKNDNNYNFNISGIVDDELKDIPCNLNIIGGKSNEIKCLVNGNSSSKIFQTRGVDNEKNEAVLIKVKNYLNYNLKYCPVSKTKLILAIVLPIAGAIIIIITIILIVRFKKKHSYNPINKNEEIDQLNNMELIK